MGEQSVCRLCAGIKFVDELIDIKNQNSVNLNLEFKIVQCLQLNFHDDLLPKSVCGDCCDKVVLTFEFQEQVKRAQELIRANLPTAEEKKRFAIKVEDADSDDHDPAELAHCLLSVDSVKEESDSESDTSTETRHINNRKCTFQRLQRKQTRNSKRPKTARRTDTVAKRKYIRRRPIKCRNELKNKEILDPEKLRRREERSAIIRRVNNEWKHYEWVCTICKIKENSVADLRHHYEQVHGKPAQYACMECPKIYEVYYNFKRHVGTHRNKYKFRCNICARFFHRKKHLQGHMETHSDLRKYICAKCGKAFKTSSNLRSHSRTHNVEIRRKYDCDICNKQLSTKASLLYHIKRHTGVRDYTCDQCGKSFVLKGALVTHLRATHSDATPYSCEKCQKRFKTQSGLTTHFKIHSDVRAHGCEICGKRFHRKGTLTRHQSVHTDALPFECEYCKKCFRMKTFLKIHLRQHTGERPYSCVECNHHFTNSSNYLKHMKGRHGVHSIVKPITPPSENGVALPNLVM